MFINGLCQGLWQTLEGSPVLGWVHSWAWCCFALCWQAGTACLPGVGWSGFQITQGCTPFAFIYCENATILKFNTAFPVPFG